MGSDEELDVDDVEVVDSDEELEVEVVEELETVEDETTA